MRNPPRTWTVLASAACLSLAAAARAAPPDQAEPAAASVDLKQATKNAADFKQIQDEYRKAQQSFSEAYRAAKDDAGRQKVVEDKYPKPDQFTRRYLAYAEANPDNPQAVEALLFVVGMSRGGEEFKRALDMIGERYAASDQVGQVVQRLAFNSDPAVEATLLKVLEKNSNRQVKGQATYALGQHYLYAGKPAEAEKRFEEVVSDYADVNGSYRGTLGDAARAQLHEARNLVVGKVAPDIEGEDVDGKTFKLSEYRGKVVVLDFWGDW